MDVNLVGTFAMVVHFSVVIASAPLIGKERGVIINTASIAAFDDRVGRVNKRLHNATLPLSRSGA